MGGGSRNISSSSSSSSFGSAELSPALKDQVQLAAAVAQSSTFDQGIITLASEVQQTAASESESVAHADVTATGTSTSASIRASSVLNGIAELPTQAEGSKPHQEEANAHQEETKATQEETKATQEEETKAIQEEETKAIQEEETKAIQEEETKAIQEEETKAIQEEETKATKIMKEETKIMKEEIKVIQEETKIIQEETKAQLEEHPAVKAAFDRITNTLTPLQQAQIAEQQWLSKLNEHSAHICALIWLHKHHKHQEAASAACSESKSASPCPDTLRLLVCSQKLDSQLNSDAYKVGCESEAWLRRLFSLDSINFDTEVDVAREAVDRVRAARRAAVKQVKSQVDGFDRLRQRALDIKQRLLPLLSKQLELCASRSASPSKSQAPLAMASDDEVQQTPIDSHAAAPASSQAQVPTSASQSSSSPPATTTSTSSWTSWTLRYPSSERIRPRFYVERSERGLTLHAQVTGLVADSLQWHVDRATRVLVVRGLCKVHTPPFQLHPLSLMFGSPLVQEAKRQQRQQWFEQQFELDAEVALDCEDSCEKQGITLRTEHDAVLLQAPFTEAAVEAARAAREAAEQRRRHEHEQYRQRLLKQKQQQQQQELRRRQAAAAAVSAGCFDYGRPLCAPSWTASGPFLFGSPFLSF